MAIDVGIKIAIALPTVLFLVGFVFKAMFQCKSLKLRHAKKNRQELVKDFIHILAIDSIFLSVANGLIYIFTLESLLIGVLALIIGLIFPMFFIVGLIAKHKLLLLGFVSFGLLTAELAHFISFGENIYLFSISIECYAVVLGFILGILIGLYTMFMAIPPIKKKG